MRRILLNEFSRPAGPHRQGHCLAVVQGSALKEGHTRTHRHNQTEDRSRTKEKEERTRRSDRTFKGRKKKCKFTAEENKNWEC